MFDNVKKAVFFGAHTDDEIIAAGTLHRLIRHGAGVFIITFGPAAVETDRIGGNESRSIVRDEWDKALDLIGVSKSDRGCRWYMPSSDMQKIRQAICQDVYDFCEREKPDLAFILSPNDENTAHSIVGVECERVMRGRVPITLRCHFPWNIDLGRPNLFVKLSEEDMEVKRACINAYQSQKFRYDYESILMGYAIADGLALKCGPVEKFEIIRGVI